MVFQVGEGKKKGQMQAFEVRLPDLSTLEERLLCAEIELADAAYQGLYSMLDNVKDFQPTYTWHQSLPLGFNNFSIYHGIYIS